MIWKIELDERANRDLDKLDLPVARRVYKFLYDRVAKLENPRSIGELLHGPKLGELWKYRVGDYRLICKIEANRLLVLVVRIGHRGEVYR